MRPRPVTLHTCLRGHMRLFSAGVVVEPYCRWRNCRAAMQEPIDYPSYSAGIRGKRDLLDDRPKPAHAENARSIEAPPAHRVALIPPEDSDFPFWKREHEANMSTRLEDIWTW